MAGETKPGVEMKPMISDPEKPCAQVSPRTPFITKTDQSQALPPDEKSSSRKSTGASRKLDPKRIILLFGTMNILLLIVNGMSSYFVYKESSRIVERPPSQLCVDCDSIRLHPDDKKENISRYEGKICCADKPGNIGRLVSYYTQHWMKVKLATEDQNYAFCEDGRTKPVLKLVGLAESQLEDSNHRLLWSEQKVSQGNISYDNKHGEILIKKSGMYHVYSQIVFRVNKAEPGIMQHTVMRVNKGYGSGHFYEEVVMRGSDTPCEDESPMHLHSSYLGSVAQLLDGDRLYVEVRSRDDIHHDKQLHWFGAHLM